MTNNQIEKRAYLRTNALSVAAKASKNADADQWLDVSVLNLSASGLLFLTDMTYEEGEILWLDLLIDPMIAGYSTKNHMKIKGVINNYRGIVNDMNAFSVVYTQISKSSRIWLDELIHMAHNAYKPATKN
jgi:hypothetical protein